MQIRRDEKYPTRSARLGVDEGLDERTADEYRAAGVALEIARN